MINRTRFVLSHLRSRQNDKTNRVRFIILRPTFACGIIIPCTSARHEGEDRTVMEHSKPSYYITTPIYYVNAKPHLGTAYCTVLADVQARFQRACGKDVKFLTGMDEHGEKVAEAAEKNGFDSPQAWCDSMEPAFRDLWETLEISNDDFIRTTQPRHIASVQKFLQALLDRGYIYKGSYDGWYCRPEETYFTETQVRHHEEDRVAAGEPPADPAHPLCPDCDRPLERIEEESWFFKLSEFQQPLLDFYEAHPDFIQPETRKNEVISFVKGGLKDLSISRSTFDWGVPFPFDDKHVAYVWVDALINYLSAVGYGAEGDEAADSLAFRWPAQVHVVGKDIIRFHTIYWPIFLMALGLPLPKQVFGHPWLLQGDGKMSKSKGNVLYADELVDFFGVDAVRYFVLHEMPFENDGVITWELMVERLNSDLANTLGNLVNRTVSMTNKYFGGVVSDKGVVEDVDADLKAVIDNTPKAVDAKMDGLRVADAITEIFNLFKRCNKYIDETMPWALAKDEEKKDRLETVLWNLIQGISAGARLLESFMPSTSKKILDQLGDGHVTEKPEILFQRLDLEEVMKKVEELHPHIEEAEEAEEEDVIDIEAKPEITFEQFGAMQFQVGEIIACEAVKKSKKLLCSQVKVGSQVKQIVSGIKAHYTPEEMVGKKVMVLVNLKPAKLAGVLSEGMLLCAEDAEGNLALMTPEKAMPAGAEIC